LSLPTIDTTPDEPDPPEPPEKPDPPPPPPVRPPQNPHPPDYPIVYVRAPRYGDGTNTRWPDISNPVDMEPGSDLVLLWPDGREEILDAAGVGAIIDPAVSFDARWVYYAKIHDVRRESLNYQRNYVPRAGADLYRIEVETRVVERLTHQEFTPNTGAGDWSADPRSADHEGANYLGYGIFNLSPCPLPGGRLMFTSSRNGFLSAGTDTIPNLQLFVMDEDGSNVEHVGHLNLGTALHPVVLADGRVMFSSSEGQGRRDARQWGVWAMWPDGRKWEPLLSAFESGAAFHFQAQLSDGSIVVEEYYNRNNNGFGTFVAFAPRPPAGRPPFGLAAPGSRTNPPLRQDGNSASERYPFSPPTLVSLTPFTHGKDWSARNIDGEFAGKVTHPSGAPRNDLLHVWTPGPANDYACIEADFWYDGGIYLLAGDSPPDSHRELRLVKDDPRYNEMFPKALVPYSAIYGIDEPADLGWLPNDGSSTNELPRGTPFGLIGSSSLIKRDTAPGAGDPNYDGLEPFNSPTVGPNGNWTAQGADAGLYDDDDIWAIRILAMEPSTHRSYGPNENSHQGHLSFYNHARERLRILGEIPVRKKDADGRPILDVDGNEDTSFLAKIPADVPFTFQTIDRRGMVLNMAQTWHQVRPGEVRNDCGGCHAHSQMPTLFESTAAARSDYVVSNLTRSTPLLTLGSRGDTGVETRPVGAVDVEYYRDVKPILQRSCAPCHSLDGRQEAELVLDDDAIVRGVENTYNRLARDREALHGRRPMSRHGRWHTTNASRYIRMFQSRRSLLVWKIFGERLDGWSNDDHPTETVPGDRSTYPASAHTDDCDIDFVGTMMPPPGSRVPALSGSEKLTIVRWIDLGCPVDMNPEAGWFLDDLRPTLTVSSPRAGDNDHPITEIRIGAFDYYSGLDDGSLSVVANFPVADAPPGTELGPSFSLDDDHVWTLPIGPITHMERGLLVIRVLDRQGNATEVMRTFSVGVGD
jgi:hypothetical protein